MGRNYCQESLKYAKDVLAGKVIACKWVKAACKRQLDDLEKYKGKISTYYFDSAAANNVCRFLELMPHIKGEWARRGEKIRLEPWQCFVTCVVFGWKRRSNGTRRFRRVYVEVARKNAKSTWSSGIANYLFAADGEAGAEVYSAATTRDQAKIVFEDSQRMARKESGFRSKFGVEVLAHSLVILDNASRFQALSADASSLDGLNIHGAIVDELHAHKTREVWDVLETATGARSQPLIWAITTAGTNRSGICYEVRGYVCKILNTTLRAHDGLGYKVEGDSATDESQFGIIYTLDDADEWTDERHWVKSNPNLGISVSLDDLREKAHKAMQLASAQPNFLTKHLNVWVNADSQWMDMLAWDRAKQDGLDIDDFLGEPCWIGIDLASKVDIAAMRINFRRDGITYAFGRYWLPEAAIESGANSQYAGWIRDGRIIESPGSVIDYNLIEDELRSMNRFEIKAVAYDPFQATQFSTRMKADGFPMIEYRPTVLNFSEPMKQLEALVLSGKYRHDGDPVMGWMISNVVCHRDAKDNIYPRKERNENKIDGAVAEIMALGVSQSEQDSGPGFWVLEQ